MLVAPKIHIVTINKSFKNMPNASSIPGNNPLYIPVCIKAKNAGPKPNKKANDNPKIVPSIKISIARAKLSPQLDCVF